MKRWMHKIEVLVDKAIPPCLLVLLVVIILDLGFSDMVEYYHLHPYIVAADYFVIAIFALDLVFKYIRTRHIPLFVKKYWLDILAVFPFFLIFRAFEFAIGTWGHTAQTILHEGLELEKEGVKVAKEAEKLITEGTRVAREAEKVGKISRTTRFTRFIKPLFRIPRFVKGIPKMLHFYEEPTGEHHENEFMKKHTKKVRRY